MFTTIRSRVIMIEHEDVEAPSFPGEQVVTRPRSVDRNRGGIGAKLKAAFHLSEAI